MAYEEVLRDLLDSDCRLDARFCIINHGCKVNRVEADTIATYLAARGGSLSGESEASVVIVNTCTVTGEADKKARKAVRHALKEAPGALVVVTGCGAAIDPHGYELLGEHVRVIPREQLLASAKPKGNVGLRSGDEFRTRVNLKIQDGCDHACTYCIVHVARGKAKSVPSKSVITEAEAYFAAGVKELVLTGIDLGSYRSDDMRLANLVGRLIESADAQIDAGGPPARIRASSLEPMSISDEFIELMAQSNGRVCRHLHIPLQSGSSKVLAEMARPYDATWYAKLVERLYARMPMMSLSTDIIVGFPGETDDDFECTMDLARECRFSKIHVFPYSRREGTPAAARLDQIPPELARARAARLRALSDELRSADCASRSGSTELALVETRFALTESYHEIAIPQGSSTGSLVRWTWPNDTIGA